MSGIHNKLEQNAQESIDLNYETISDSSKSDHSKNELYGTHQKMIHDSKPWWRSNFFIREPILFGTWDGVYTSCILNVFGMVIFLRAGWVVGNAGIGLSFLMIFLSLVLVYIAVISAIGICERCLLKEGGVYSLISHVLGQRAGCSISIVYCIGQACSAALFVSGLAENITNLTSIENTWVQRGIAISFLTLLLCINLAGIHWVIRVQLLLLGLLGVSLITFLVGTFLPHDMSTGVIGYSTENLKINMAPSFMMNENFFTVFGVLFPTVCGIFTGVNMSGQLREPTKSVPLGTLSALITVTFLYVIFTFTIGFVVTRSALQTDYNIASKVSAFSPLFLTGVYVSALSAALGGLTGAPRLLQSIASSTDLNFLRCFKPTMGDSKVPIVALLFLILISMLCCLFGDMNLLSPLVTIPFLTTYTSMSYAYFCLALAYDTKIKRDIAYDSITKTKNILYGDEHFTDLDKLFPERKLTGDSNKVPSVKSSLLPVKRDDSNKFLKENEEGLILSKTNSWYSWMLNRWSSLFGTCFGIVLMFIISWGYTFLVISIILLLYLFSGMGKQALAKGVASELDLTRRVIDCLNEFCLATLNRCCPGLISLNQRREMAKKAEDTIIMMDHGSNKYPTPFGSQNSERVTEPNQDFADRDRYHSAKHFSFEK